MSIRWDSVLVRQLAAELDRELRGARLRALRLDGSSRDLVLLFRDRTLLWRLHPERGSLHERAPVEPTPSDLRLRTRVRGVSAPVDERIVRFELLGERGKRSFYDLIVELIGNRWNAVVTEGPEAVIRHVLVRREGRRRLLVGGRYAPPEGTARILDAAPEGWVERLKPIPPEHRAREAVSAFAWLSPLNVDTVLGAAGRADEAGGRPRDSNMDEGALRAAFARWRALAAGEDPEPVIVGTSRGPQPYPFPVVGRTVRPARSVLEALDACAGEVVDTGTVPSLALPPELLVALDDAVRHHERKVGRLRSELRNVEEPARLRSIGDLILARYGDIPPGADHATLDDFEGNPIRVELDPALRPNENANRYYDRAGRAERAQRRLPGLIEEARAALVRVEALRSRAHAGDADPDAIRGALPAPPTRGARGGGPAPLPYRSFRSSGGLEIRVGRGARHNDDLTFRHSAPGDVWLHARHVAGAHVVLRWAGPGAPPARDLEEAASLAALHSKARTSGSVPVDWTLRKYVRKPRGSAPGSVVPDRVKTVFVEPDPALAEALATHSGEALAEPEG